MADRLIVDGDSEGCTLLGCGGMIFLILIGYAVLEWVRSL